MERVATQPEWVETIVGMDSHGITIEDAYIVTGTKRPIGDDIPVVRLELDSKRSSVGYWYYNDRHDQWYWSAGTVKEVTRKALDEVIKPNFDLDEFAAAE